MSSPDTEPAQRSDVASLVIVLITAIAAAFMMDRLTAPTTPVPHVRIIDASRISPANLGIHQRELPSLIVSYAKDLSTAGSLVLQPLSVVAYPDELLVTEEEILIYMSNLKAQTK